MRAAFLPRSPWPRRETERTSIRLPPAVRVTRTTMSSLNPNQIVVSVASIRPSAGTAATICQPRSRAAFVARVNAHPAVRQSWPAESGYAMRCCGRWPPLVFNALGDLAVGDHVYESWWIIGVRRNVVDRRNVLALATCKWDTNATALSRRGQRQARPRLAYRPYQAPTRAIEAAETHPRAPTYENKRPRQVDESQLICGPAPPTIKAQIRPQRSRRRL